MSNSPVKNTVKLGSLSKGTHAVIVRVGRESTDFTLVKRLLEMGLLEGSTVEVAHEAPFGDPIAVKVRGGMIALRRSEADLIEVCV
jgi:Fe2+ transport system protein FeoA